MRNIHGGDIYQFSHKVLDFSANINPLGLPESVELAIKNSIAESTHYPDPHCRLLTRKLSAYENLPQEYIVCGNGAADIIYRLVYYKKPKKALLLAPTFSEYEAALNCIGCEIIYHYLVEENNFILTENILPLVPNYDIIFICNPNNPTGQLVNPQLISQIVEIAAKNSVILVIDECFLSFVEDNAKLSAQKYLQKNCNLIILKAFTKFYAMAGVRLGYALSSPEICAGVEEFGQPWSVSVLAQAAGVAALSEHEYARKTFLLIPEQRLYLSTELSNLGFKVFESCANYIFFKSSISDLKERLIYHHILIRDCNNYRGLGEGYYRIAIKNYSDNQTLIRALKEQLI